MRNPESRVEGCLVSLIEAVEADSKWAGEQVGMAALKGKTEEAHALVDSMAGYRSFLEGLDRLWDRWNGKETAPQPNVAALKSLVDAEVDAAPEEAEEPVSPEPFPAPQAEA